MMKVDYTEVKAEEQDVTGIPTPPKSAPSCHWMPHDVFCSSLFGPWNDLPCTDFLSKPALLRNLDRVIVLFEARIEHSDEGLRHWRERHKRAMEAGVAEIPGFPSLRLLRNGKSVWQDDVWEQRYQYLIYQRQQMILARIKSQFRLSRQQTDDFFGHELAPPREMFKRRTRVPYNRRPLALRCDWWRPLDVLLERAAEDWHMDKGKVKAQFWNEGTAHTVTKVEKRKASEELVRVKREPSPPGLSLGIGEGKMELFKGLDMVLMWGDDKTQGDMASMKSLPVKEQMSF